MESPILFVGAHPDDIEINAGGTIKKLLSENKEIVLFIATHGKDKVRKDETWNAVESLCEGYLDKVTVIIENNEDGLLYENLRRLITQLDSVISTYKIKTIVTHYPYDTHQDHACISQASIISGRNTNNIIYYSPTYPSGRPDIPFNPNLSISLTLDQINSKVKALSFHKSQIKKYGNKNYLSIIKTISKAEAWKYAGEHGYVELFQISRSKY